jgi:hypothetical protein
MFAIKKFTNAISRRMHLDRKLDTPEPVYGKPRPAVGFFAGLTDEQKAKALAYRGDENHGELRFAR